MRESIFRFKQFEVRNHLAAMKVGTDGVLLGAWCRIVAPKHVLDIGTGTGLIALMIAQRDSKATIDALDIEKTACEEAAYNVAHSPWSGRIRVVCGDFRSYACRDYPYDLIISNPPYFENGVLPAGAGRIMARHCATLTYGDLIGKSASILSGNGRICIITPADVEACISGIVASNGLHVARKTYVRPKPGSIIKRILWEICPCDNGCETDELIIETETHNEYTEQYIALTKEFYLKM